MTIKRNIILINQVPGHVFIDITNAYYDKDYNVSIWCGEAFENTSVLHEKVRKEKGPTYNKRSLFKRLLTWLKFTFWVRGKLGSVRNNKDFLTLVSTNPPFLPLLLLSPFRGKIAILVFDLYPDILPETFLYRPIKKLWRKLNRKLFEKVDVVFTISNIMVEELAKYTDIGKVQLIPNWSSFNSPQFIPHSENTLRTQYFNEDDFVVLYAGNMGLTHPLESLIYVADLLRNQPRIKFLLVGDGPRKQKLVSLVKKMDLQNVQFLPFQPEKDINKVLSAGDIAVITLGQKFSSYSLPSKLYNYIAFNLPLLAIASPKSELSKIIEEKQLGLVASEDDIEGLAKGLDEMYSNPGFIEECRLRCAGYSSEINHNHADRYTELFN